VYVSTFYVNNFKPYNTPVPEEVHYPTLQLAGKPQSAQSGLEGKLAQCFLTLWLSFTIVTVHASAARPHSTTNKTCAVAAVAAVAAAAAAAAGDPKELTYNELTDSLLHTTSTIAAAEVTSIMERLNFTSTYAFSKLLTEQLIDDPATLPGVSKVIVRPSLIASMAGSPYPG
jgi:hypothetical protein